MSQLALALVPLALLAGCPRPRLAAGTVVLLVESPPETLDRRLALSATAENVSGHLLEPGLLRLGDDGRPTPDLAESFESLDPTTYVFTLRPGLVFSDGSPLVAADVVATFESLSDPRLGSPLAVKYQEIASIEALDARRVRVRLRAPFAPFLADMSMGIVPARAQAAPGREAFGRHPIGAGPFRVVSWDTDERLLLEANPRYYGGAPAITQLLVKTIRDETTRALELRSGRADLEINALSPPLVAELARAPHLRVASTPGADAAYLMFQLDDPRLADRRVREAIADSIDREALIRYKFLGRAQLATSLLPPGNWAHAVGLREVVRDLPRARALLDAAGLRVRPSGTRLRVTYKTSTDRFRKSVALALAQQLEEAQIGVDVVTLEFGTFFADVRKGRFELASLKWTPILDPDLLYWVFDSASIPTPENGYSGGNREHYRNPEVDALLEAARGGASEVARLGDYGAAQRILDRDKPYFVLWYEDNVAVIRDDLVGFRLSPYGSLESLAQARREGRP